MPQLSSSPSSLPVDLLMKCRLVQAAQITGSRVAPAGSPGSSASQCCTFNPVRGHLNTIWRPMPGSMMTLVGRQNSGCLRRSSDITHWRFGARPMLLATRSQSRAGSGRPTPILCFVCSRTGMSNRIGQLSLRGRQLFDLLAQGARCFHQFFASHFHRMLESISGVLVAKRIVDMLHSIEMS